MEIKRNHIRQNVLHNIKIWKDNWEAILGVIIATGIIIEIYIFAIVIPSR
jgi:hypothetical protein